jgi:hypothetical protein
MAVAMTVAAAMAAAAMIEGAGAAAARIAVVAAEMTIAAGAVTSIERARWGSGSKNEPATKTSACVSASETSPSAELIATNELSNEPSAVRSAVSSAGSAGLNVPNAGFSAALQG